MDTHEVPSNLERPPSALPLDSLSASLNSKTRHEGVKVIKKEAKRSFSKRSAYVAGKPKESTEKSSQQQ